MVRFLNWSLTLGDIAAVGTSIWHTWDGTPGEGRVVVAALIAAAASLGWTLGHGLLRHLGSFPESFTPSDAGWR